MCTLKKFNCNYLKNHIRYDIDEDKESSYMTNIYDKCAWHPESLQRMTTMWGLSMKLMKKAQKLHL